MTAKNLATCMGPNVIKVRTTDCVALIEMQNRINAFTEFLIANAETIFAEEVHIETSETNENTTTEKCSRSKKFSFLSEVRGHFAKRKSEYVENNKNGSKRMNSLNQKKSV